MGMLHAGLAVAAMFIGAIGAFLGVVILISALQSGSIHLSYGTGAGAVTETVSRTGEAARYWQYLIALGAAPAVFGSLAARWGWRAINRS